MRNTDGEGETEEARIPMGRPTQEIDRATDAERERERLARGKGRRLAGGSIITRRRKKRLRSTGESTSSK
jgi:hypothetical protein